MSGICIFDLKSHNLNYEQLNTLSKRLVKEALKTNTAIFFNSYDYGEEIIRTNHMKNFFLISDSFLYKNCNLLDTSIFSNMSDKKATWRQFRKRYDFFKRYLKVIFHFGIEDVNVYISNNVSDTDFKVIKSVENNSLFKIFSSIYDNAEDYAYGFPTIKLVITKHR